MKTAIIRNAYRLCILLLLGIIACQENEYVDMSFNTYIKRRLFLSEYGCKAKQSKEEDRKKYLIAYFNALPRDFETLFKIIKNNCYKDIIYTVRRPWSYRFSHNPWGKFHPVNKIVQSKEEIPREHISNSNAQYLKNHPALGNYMNFLEILPELEKIIPDTIYYEKMIGLGIGGFWDADDIGFTQLHLKDLAFFHNEELAMHILDKKTDDEIASFFYFLYDGPHPENHRSSYEIEYRHLNTYNPRIAELLKKAYTQLLSEKHCPGH